MSLMHIPYIHEHIYVPICCTGEKDSDTAHTDDMDIQMFLLLASVCLIVCIPLIEPLDCPVEAATVAEVAADVLLVWTFV